MTARSCLCWLHWGPSPYMVPPAPANGAIKEPPKPLAPPPPPLPPPLLLWPDAELAPLETLCARGRSLTLLLLPRWGWVVSTIPAFLGGWMLSKTPAAKGCGKGRSLPLPLEPHPEQMLCRRRCLLPPLGMPPSQQPLLPLPLLLPLLLPLTKAADGGGAGCSDRPFHHAPGIGLLPRSIGAGGERVPVDERLRERLRERERERELHEPDEAEEPPLPPSEQED
ncbi:unnamed protein product, partial [Ectocarpus sp. 8 AP-2014]